jgi:hypothetical protein
MKKILFAVILLSGTMLFSCKSGGSDDPKGVLTEFFEALSKKDIAKARTLATEDSKSMLDMMEMGMKMDKDTSSDSKFDKAKMEFGEAKIEGDKAVVPVKETTSGETMNYTLKKENGNWKVAFDKSSMMTMGMDKMNEKGIDADSLRQEGMEELKGMNMDSLKTEVDKAMQSIDSTRNP